jgi:hypothetical protein
LATFTALASAATACAVAWVLPASATGATLAVLSLGALGAAGRLSILLAGLASGASGSDDDLGPNAIAAHQTLTGLVIGSTGAATLGALVDMASSVRGGCPWPIAATFVTVVGLVLVLRARTHIDPRRRTVLAVGGLMTSAAAVALIVISAPRQAYWVCMLAAAVGVGMLGDLNRRPVNPLARRAVDVLEYIALAALVPLASWVAGLYSVVRGLSLP